MKDMLKKNDVVSIPLSIYVLAFAIFWTIVIAGSLVWNLKRENSKAMEAARIQARAAFDKDVLYRSWNAGYGGGMHLSRVILNRILTSMFSNVTFILLPAKN